MILLTLLAVRRAVMLVGALLPARPTRADAGARVALLTSMRNEVARAAWLLAALDRLDYPKDRLTVLLADDASSDGTASMLCEYARGKPWVRVVRLADQVGKAEALNRLAALAPEAELIAVYDAEHAPEPDSLRLLVGAAMADARTGCVAGYLAARNARVSLVARYGALESWVTQLVHHAGKDRLWRNAPTLGGNCVYRRAALEAIGGFPAGALSEDTEASLAMLAKGWRSRFVREARATMSVAATVEEFWEQRTRWNRGLLRAARHATGMESILTALGYLDRLVLLAVLGLAGGGWMSAWWAVGYLMLPLAASVVAIAKAGAMAQVGSTVAAAVLLLPLDIAVTAWSAGMGLVGQRVRWR
jgi:cellulose synthase/poly-beta-1,6-N-acetylglucosamine synthase-like glycosyltransferase